MFKFSHMTEWLFKQCYNIYLYQFWLTIWSIILLTLENIKIFMQYLIDMHTLATVFISHPSLSLVWFGSLESINLNILLVDTLSVVTSVDDLSTYKTKFFSAWPNVNNKTIET